MPESMSLSKYAGINLGAKTRQARGPTSVEAFVNLLLALSFTFARLVTLLLLQRKLVFGRVPILLIKKLGGNVLPQLSTFPGELLLEGTHDLGNDL